MATSNGGAFVKGGCGCIAAFFAIGFLFLLSGSGFSINAGAAIVLFLIGGVIGLICLSIYGKGERAGRQAGQSIRRLNTPRNDGPFGEQDPNDGFDSGPFDSQGDGEFRSNGPFDDWGGDNK